jgi:DNA-binding beta-propeller fold protein YncE
VSRKVYLNLQDLNQLVAIDPVTDTVIARYRIGECKGNHGMSLDVEHHRAFLACEENDLMSVFDLDKQMTIVSLPLASGPDVIKYDAGTGRIYVACSSGAISVFHEDDPDHFRKLGDVAVQKKVHSLAVDEQTHRVYAPEEQENGRPVARLIVYEAVTKD